MDYMCTGGLINEVGINRSCSVYSVESTHTLDGGVQNSLMASVAGHKFWDMVINIAATERRPTLLQSFYLNNPNIHYSTGSICGPPSFLHR
jgi:hypothetical protein